MGRTKPGDYTLSWSPPTYTVDERGKVVGASVPEPHNWGRFGEDDEQGTTRLITPDKVAKAAALVRSGRCYSLAIPIDSDAPVHYTRPRAQRVQTLAGSDYIVGSPANIGLPGYQWTDDVIIMALQGSTQWDGLAHFMRDDCMYNGWWSGNVTAAAGAARNGVQHQRETLIGRGVLIDCCLANEGRPLEGGHAISPEELDEVLSREGVTLESGDIVLVRTGKLGEWYAAAGDRAAQDAWFESGPGLSVRVADWCRQHDVAALGIDNMAIDVMPPEPGSEVPWPFHHAAIPGLGMTVGEFFWLDDLALACEQAGRYAFFLAAQPLYFVGGCGSMLNPVAVL